ncbi:MAG: hypothetical protein K2I49_00490, partial [Ureaplasma sp.]|nr:hypothetical protein [Ureaplasma sp.]
LTHKLLNASKNLSTDLKDIDNIIKIVAIDKIYSSYSRLTPGWFLPILKSEDHSDVLNEINNSSAVPNYSTFHYILNRIIKQKIVKAHTDTFNEVISSFKLISNNGQEIYGVEMQGLSFWEEHKQRTVYKSGVGITVPYIEYIPTIASKYIFMTYIKNEWKHLFFWELINRWKNNSLDSEISPIIQKYKEQDILICIDRSILTIMSDKLPKEVITNIFDELASVISKYN